MRYLSTAPLLLLLASAAHAQVRWTDLRSFPRPSARSIHAVVWMDDRAILFGGETKNKTYLNDTWAWQRGQWQQLNPKNKPSPRGAHMMAYDPGRKRLLLFSGWTGSDYVRDTWEFDGTDWQKMQTKFPQPPARDSGQMGYDPITKTIILFGGRDWKFPTYGDTWSWNGKEWTQLKPATSPSARQGTSLVLTGLNGTLMLVGHTDMWTWLGNNWSRFSPRILPPSRFRAPAAYDEHRGVLVMHGGQTLTDTWELARGTWTRRLASGGPVVSSQAFYDPVRREVIVFGGALNGNRATPSDRTLAYGPVHSAGFRAFGSGCKGSAGTPVLDSTPPWIGAQSRLTVSKLRSSAATVVYFGTSRTRWGSFRLPFDLSSLGASGCWLHVAPDVGLALTATGGRAQLSFSLPKNPWLAGKTLFVQGFAADAAANRLGIVASNGGELRIGSK